MKTSFHRRGLGFIALLGVFGMCGTTFAADNPNVVARDAWVRLPVASRTETAAYLVIENKSAVARSLVSASSPDAAKIEMHEMKMMGSGKAGEHAGMSHAPGGMMTMAPVARIDIPAKGQATLAPNGYHLMVFGLKSKLAAGGKLAITLKLDDGSTVPVSASVRSPE